MWTSTVRERAESGGDSALASRGAMRAARDAVILLAEDDPDIRAALVESLEATGYEVVAVADGLEAMAKLVDGLEPAVVVVDLMMPGMDGWDLLRRLRADPIHASRPVLAMSAATEERPEGASAFLSKPFLLHEFRDVLSALLAGQGTLDARGEAPTASSRRAPAAPAGPARRGPSRAACSRRPR